MHRATRVQLDSVPALVSHGDGQRARGRLQVLSETGGLLQLARALAEGDFVEVAFQVQVGNVRGMAEMLTPVRTVPGSVFQPFRFVALGDDDHDTLRMAVNSASDKSFFGLRSRSWTEPRS
ncbi:MAG: hypothetical protein JOZ14_18705 [Acidobacteria bacterium]|nr:hypothetical protein [Acidobacteriota bacterium]